jgi:predicted metal-dependent phosphoesterase TrpH
MPGHIDLHIHTFYSDGLASPEEVVKSVRQKKLAAFAICDHDNLEGYLKAKELLKNDGPELISGVELSSGKDDEDIHILGYDMVPDNDFLNDALDKFRLKRNQRGKKMLIKLKEMGIDIPYELVLEIAGYSAIGRPHIADALVRAKKIGDYETAFRRYIGKDGPAYVPKDNLEPKKAIELIHKAGGLAFLAHPGIGRAGQYIDEFIIQGLDGIEVYHPKHGSRLKKIFLKMAEEKSLLTSGGSDFHAREGRLSMIGSQSVPYENLARIKERQNIKNRGVN